MKKYVVMLVLAVCLVALFAFAAAPASACHNLSYSPGFWAQHPEAWWGDAIDVGGVWYTKDVAVSLMLHPVQGDKSYTMFSAMIAAKLNDSADAYGEIAAADAWMTAHPLGNGIAASSLAWQGDGEALCNALHTGWE